MSSTGTIGCALPAGSAILRRVQIMRGDVEEDTDSIARVRAGDVGIFGTGRIVSAFAGIAALFYFIVRLTVAVEVSQLRVELEKFKADMKAEYIPGSQVVTRAEWTQKNDERTRIIKELQDSDVATLGRVGVLEERVRELERLSDRNGNGKH